MPFRIRRLVTISFVIFLLCQTNFVIIGNTSTVELPHHADFEKTAQNLAIITNFLNNSKKICESSLSNSVSIKINDSIENAHGFEKNLAILNAECIAISGHAESSRFLADYLEPFNNLSEKLLVFVYQHQILVENLTFVIEYLNYSADFENKTIIAALNNAYEALGTMRISLASMKHFIIKIGEKKFDVEQLLKLAAQLDHLLFDYECQLDELANYFLKTTILSLYIIKDVYYLGETIEGHGTFLWYGVFVQNHTIQLNLTHCATNSTASICTVGTNRYGKFEFNWRIPTEYLTGRFELKACAYYSRTYVESKPVELDILRIPTTITLNTTLTLITPYTEYLVGEQIPLSGKLTDHKFNGLADKTINIVFGHKIVIVRTNLTGEYSAFVPTAGLNAGVYTVFARFEGDDIYEPSGSQKLRIILKIPVSLTLSASKKTCRVGETVKLTGRLVNLVTNSGIPAKDITIFANNVVIGNVKTDPNGEFIFEFTPSEKGNYIVHCEFKPTEIEYQSARSAYLKIVVEELELTLQIVFSFLAVTVVAVCLIFIYYRRTPRKPKFEKVPKKLVQVPKKSTLDLTKDIEALCKISNLRLQVIDGYLIWLNFLKTTGIPIKDSHTHREIAFLCIAQGMNKNDVNLISEMFEKVRYANITPSVQDLDKFTTTLSNITRV